MHTPVHTDMTLCKATSFVTTKRDLRGKGRSPRGAVYPACLSVSQLRDSVISVGKMTASLAKKQWIIIKRAVFKCRSRHYTGIKGAKCWENGRDDLLLWGSSSTQESKRLSARYLKHHQLATSSTSSLCCGGFFSLSGWGCSRGLLLDEEVPTLSDVLLLE